MKTALYFENGYAQVVLTAENDFEQQALQVIATGSPVTVKEGEFYHCAGGWVRTTPCYRRDDQAPKSLMLIATKNLP